MNQRQRDLKTNELEKLVSSATPWLEEHGNKLIYVACAAMLAFALYYYVSQSSAVERSAGWSEFVTASELDDYANIASRYKGTPPGQWALLTQANRILEDGLRGSFTNREGAISDLNSAAEKYKELLNDPKIAPELEERALFGLARTLETLAGKDTSDAVKAYQRLLEKYPDSIFKKVAEEQIAGLKTDEGREFYAWFVAQDPKPTSPTNPFGGLPDEHPPVDPGSLIRLPETPEMLKLPEDSAPAFPEGLDESGTGSSFPPPPPEPVNPGTESDAPDGTAPPLPEIPKP